MEQPKENIKGVIFKVALPLIGLGVSAAIGIAYDMSTKLAAIQTNVAYTRERLTALERNQVSQESLDHIQKWAGLKFDANRAEIKHLEERINRLEPNHAPYTKR